MAEKQEHPQAKWLRAIADGETLQGRLHGSPWQDLNTVNVLDYIRDDCLSRDIRVKPRTIKIGSYEVAEPMKVAPAENTKYWTLNQIDERTAYSYRWGNDATDAAFLAKGMCWIKREDAELAAKAISELLLGK